jgi:uncharacterized protein YceK
MRNVVIGMAIVALLSGCGGTSHPATSTTVAPKKTHAQLLATAHAKAAAAAAAHRLAVAAAKARTEGYTVNNGDPAGFKYLTTPKSHPRRCDEFGNFGCWMVEIVTFKECPFFEMDVNEMRRGAVLETYRENQADVAPNTLIHGEFDATGDNTTLATPVFTCNVDG